MQQRICHVNIGPTDIDESGVDVITVLHHVVSSMFSSRLGRPVKERRGGIAVRQDRLFLVVAVI